MRLLLVRNARSGTSGRRSKIDALVVKLEAEGARVDSVAPDTAEETREIAATARRERYDVLLAAGGDGTLSVIANGLVETPAAARPALAIVPAGRGNDFASELGLETADDTLASITNDHRRRVDLGRTDAGVFLGIGGAGFDAQTARRAQTTPLLAGSLLYSYAVLRTLLEFRHLGARVRFEGGQYEGPITFAAVGNSRRYGGGMHITPRADLSDGRLDLCLVKDISRASLLYMFPTVFRGAHLSHAKVDYHQTRFVEIDTDEPAELFADGEFLQRTPVRIDVLPAELEVLTPRK